MHVIYIIRNKVNGKVYIGQTCRFSRRKAQHLHDTRRGRYLHKPLCRAFAKYGEEAFEFEILEECATLELTNEREKHWIAVFDSYNLEKGYNLTQGGEGTSGYVYTEQDRQKMSEAQRKRPPMSEETKKKIGDAHRGEKNHNFGKKLSSKTRQKISDANKNPSAETRERFRQISLGRTFAPRSNESKERSRKARKGKCVGKDHPMFAGHPRQKLSEDSVIMIKKSPASVTNKELALKFNVDAQTIWAVRLGKTWKHVRPDLNREPHELYTWHNGHTAKKQAEEHIVSVHNVPVKAQ